MNYKYLYYGLVTACAAVLLLLFSRLDNAVMVENYHGPMRSVDGDTLASGKIRLRLKGIDAPELHQTCMMGDAVWQCGFAARDFLQRLVAGDDLVCKSGGTDKYRRPLVICFAGGLEVNREMVIMGLAVDYGAYHREATDAEKARRGLWDSRFERPEAWRRTRATMEDEAFNNEEETSFWSSIRAF